MSSDSSEYEDDRSRGKTSECCGRCPFVKIFLCQIFVFGYSCGSLISEILGLLRTFQR